MSDKSVDILSDDKIKFNQNNFSKIKKMTEFLYILKISVPIKLVLTVCWH